MNRAAVSDAAAALEPDVYHGLKASLHARVVDRLDLETLGRLTTERLTQELTALLAQMVADKNLPLNRREREKMVHELIDDILGLGPLEALLRDPSISDILVNTFDTIYVERKGRLELTSLRFRDNDHLQQTISRIVSRVGRRVDEASPMVDARLPDGSRVNAIIPPLAVDGPLLSIRRFGGAPLRTADLVQAGAMTEAMRVFLEACVKAKFNILVAGGTGTGKTTMLNALSSFIPDYERIVTIEDAAELQLQQQHVVRLETRPPNVEGKGEVLTRDLVRNSLRMRPDRIIVGEIRSAEIIDMLQAMNTGHEGSMATLHANTARDAVTRMMAMIGMSGLNVTEQVVCQMLARALDLIVQLQRGADGKRRVVAISEITGTEGTVIQMQDVFVFRQHGADAEGRAIGEFAPTGLRPRCAERLERAGFELPPSLFALRERRG
ncbi:CpaF family protein [Pendulispora albinea]|uniref:CpaF family protein n=1 Tax=Pendulispora albinea TaxID=2741071 RepID=A0ABZ2LSI3_9BACT